MTPQRLGGPAYRSPLGALGQYRRDPLRLFYEESRRHGGSVRIRIAHQHLHLLVDPEDVQLALADRADDFAKGVSYRSLRHLLGDGLLTADGDLWKRQRALIRPSFSRRHVLTEVPVVAECAERLLARLEVHAASGEPFDLVPEVMTLALDVVCRTALGNQEEGLFAAIAEDTQTSVDWVMDHMSAIVPLPPGAPTPGGRAFRAARARLYSVVDRVIDGHPLADGVDDDALLGRLLAARDEDGEPMSRGQLREEVLTLLLAGHETTGGALAWTIYELCRTPQVLADLYDEVDAGGDPAGLDLVSRVVDESMRLHPPAWAFSRTSLAEIDFPSFRMPEGAMVAVSPFVLHRWPEWWPSPLTFDPDRFTADRVRNRPKLHYLPFGYGPHMCVGASFATIEIRVTLARMLSRFSFELVEGMRVRERPQISNPPERVLVRVRRREFA